ncbi:hypothetical protein [Borrelia sp. RT1S]|uniref:hypothetical protein n=1 Tax=Borrelia sp. RT1S TaxID=2898580 RepID=UPI001E2F1E59|nr:hypothetical protein [Borrelia sp. RT1S]UGQ18000.1 hypothetical protein LSO05_06085 [Borrelia sp. RT1S]
MKRHVLVFFMLVTALIGCGQDVSRSLDSEMRNMIKQVIEENKVNPVEGGVNSVEDKVNPVEGSVNSVETNKVKPVEVNKVNSSEEGKIRITAKDKGRIRLKEKPGRGKPRVKVRGRIENGEFKIKEISAS